ncbi:MAG: hypothetical protein ABIR59_04125, partial [Gemmatimonadales bacterium]
RDGRPMLLIQRDPAYARLCLDAIVATVSEFLATEALAPQQVATVFAPQFSPEFTAELRRMLPLSHAHFVDAPPGRRDLFTSSLSFAFRQVIDHGPGQSGCIGLVITVGSGVQVGCALYYF